MCQRPRATWASMARSSSCWSTRRRRSRSADIYMCIYIYTYTHTCVYVYLYYVLCIYIYIYAYINAYMHIYIYICICIAETPSPVGCDGFGLRIRRGRDGRRLCPRRLIEIAWSLRVTGENTRILQRWVASENLRKHFVEMSRCGTRSYLQVCRISAKKPQIQPVLEFLTKNYA